jgi:hypothetical protein
VGNDEANGDVGGSRNKLKWVKKVVKMGRTWIRTVPTPLMIQYYILDQNL